MIRLIDAEKAKQAIRNWFDEAEVYMADEMEVIIDKQPTEHTGYQCFHCGQNTVYWSGDFSFEDYGYDGEGIIQECHCYNCGADIRYMIPIPDIEEDDTYVGLTD